jgi:hypothetical protein
VEVGHDGARAAEVQQDWVPGVKPDKEKGIKGRLPVGYRLLGPATILVPPRDGSTLHPDVIKQAFLDMSADYRIDTVVMDISRAEDIASWIEDELGIVTVIDREQGNRHAVRGLRRVYRRAADEVAASTLATSGLQVSRPSRHRPQAPRRRLPV